MGTAVDFRGGCSGSGIRGDERVSDKEHEKNTSAKRAYLMTISSTCIDSICNPSGPLLIPVKSLKQKPPVYHIVRSHAPRWAWSYLFIPMSGMFRAISYIKAA